jgi:Lipocalin-like domain
MCAELTGTWRLVSAVMEDVETKVQTRAWGEHPSGWLILTPERRWMVIQTAEGRKPSRDDAARADAFRSMLAYSGAYRVEGNKIVIDVDISWDEAWIGTEQVRLFEIDGDRLHIEALPQPYANFGGKVMRGILTWQRNR